MPPKKKKGGKKKGKDDGELQIEDKYKKALEEIEMLKEHLAVRKELARRSRAASEDWKERMQEAEKTLDEKANEQLSVNADISRQYKTMQHEMGLRNTMLEIDVQQLSANLVLAVFQIAFLGELGQVAMSPVLWNLFFNPDLPKEPVKTVY
ncbi:hypothetical protein LSAT2_018085 [Lamellibrachia satsuma]|nr:hypothetical protein LSAT2_018085 [Lamellibrachia satsuma]